MTLSLFTEEIFHQIADFGIWLQKGYSLSQFFKLQIFTSLFVVLGSLIFESVSEGNKVHINIFVLTSLTFTIYTQIVPELIEKKDSLFLHFI